MRQIVIGLLVLAACGAPGSGAPGSSAKAVPHAPRYVPAMIDGPPHPRVAVIGVQSHFGGAQYGSTAGRATVGYVEVVNDGAQAEDAEVLCIVRAQRNGTALDHVITTMTARVSQLGPRERRVVDLSVPTSEVRSLAVGDSLPVSCGTRSVGSAGAYTHTRTDFVAFAPYEAPDLRWREDGPWLDAYDCDTRAVPVAGRDVCIDLFVGEQQGMASEAAQRMKWIVACRIGDRTARAESSWAELQVSIAMRFTRVAAGWQDVHCTLDADRRIAEANEQDNHANARVQVLASNRDWRYGAALRRVAATARWLQGGPDTPQEPAYAVEVVVSNTGRHPLRGLDIECAGGGIVFRGGGASTLPEHPIGPGDTTLELVAEGALPPPGNVTVSCTLRVTSPAVPVTPYPLAATIALPP